MDSAHRVTGIQLPPVHVRHEAGGQSEEWGTGIQDLRRDESEQLRERRRMDARQEIRTLRWG